MPSKPKRPSGAMLLHEEAIVAEAVQQQLRADFYQRQVLGCGPCDPRLVGDFWEFDDDGRVIPR